MTPINTKANVDEIVEKMARAACNRHPTAYKWDDISKSEQEAWRTDMEAALSASNLLSHIAMLEMKLKEGEWQPIETAPKDGTKIAAFYQYVYPGDKDRTCGVIIISWDEDLQQWEDSDEPYNEHIFSHWQPLPAAPPQTKSKSEG